MSLGSLSWIFSILSNISIFIRRGLQLWSLRDDSHHRHGPVPSQTGAPAAVSRGKNSPGRGDGIEIGVRSDRERHLALERETFQRTAAHGGAAGLDECQRTATTGHVRRREWWKVWAGRKDLRFVVLWVALDWFSPGHGHLYGHIGIGGNAKN